MSNATKMPDTSEILYFQWSRPSAPNPRLASPIDDDDTTITFTSAPQDKDGSVITTPFLMGIRNSDSYTETVYCPNGADGASGLSATGCIRGVDISGTDWTTGDTGFADDHEQDSPIFCNIPAVFPALLTAALQGSIATGGANLLIGTDAAGTVTIKRSTGAGTSLGFLRYNNSTSKTQYSDDGAAWVNLTDVSASDLLKVSANDSTPGYLNGKLVAGSNVILTEGNDGANETLTVAATSQRTGVTTHVIYTPGFLTGDTGAQATWNLWIVVTDGSFRITVDGTAYNVDGIDFSTATSMATVASLIQAALRTQTGSTETVAWSTDHFIITSVDTTSASEVSVLSTSTGTVGTDISGAGASDWMDADVGNGIATAAVLDATQDVGKVALLDAAGLFDEGMMPADVTTLIDKSSGDLLHTHTVPIRKTSSMQVAGTALARYDGTYRFLGAGLTDAATIECTTIDEFYLPSGMTVSSIKIYFFLPTAVTGNVYGDFAGISWGAGADSVVTIDTVAATAYAGNTSGNNQIVPVTVPAAAYASWSAGEYFSLSFQRVGANAADTWNQNAHAILTEVIYTIT